MRRSSRCGRLAPASRSYLSSRPGSRGSGGPELGTSGRRHVRTLGRALWDDDIEGPLLRGGSGPSRAPVEDTLKLNDCPFPFRLARAVDEDTLRNRPGDFSSRFNGRMKPRWHVLVAEAQFATELTVAGLRRLCLVPGEVNLERWVGDDRNYALHVGMHSYASGQSNDQNLWMALGEVT